MVKELVLQGKLDALKDLLESRGVDFVKGNANPKELSSLHWASGTGNLEIVKFFLSPPISEDPNLPRQNNFYPIHVAAMQGQVATIKLLREFGADVNVQTEPQKYAPIHSAAFGGQLESVQALVALGANIQLENYRGEMPIDTAKRQNQTAVVQYLESLEADNNDKLAKVQQGMMTLLNKMSSEKQSAEDYQSVIQNYLKDCEQKGWIKAGSVAFLENDEDNTGQFNLKLSVIPNIPVQEFVLELTGSEGSKDNQE